MGTHTHPITHLVCDVLPVVLAAKLLQVLPQQSTHVHDALSHHCHLLQVIPKKYQNINNMIHLQHDTYTTKEAAVVACCLQS